MWERWSARSVLTYLREQAERRREERERDGLLRLVLAETLINTASWVLFKESPDLTIEEAFPPVRLEVWKEVRVRLPQLMPSDEFETIHNYYLQLDIFHTFLERYRRAYGTDQEPEFRKAALGQLETNVVPSERRMRALLDKYVD